MKILVVDDTKSVQLKLANLLRAQGHQVDTADNGLDALSKVKLESYQLFVIDHLMPLMDGLQLIKNFKKTPAIADKKIIFITTQGNKAVKMLPEYPLFDRVIEKPIDVELFLTALSELTKFHFESETLEVIA